MGKGENKFAMHEPFPSSLFFLLTLAYLQEWHYGGKEKRTSFLYEFLLSSRISMIHEVRYRRGAPFFDTPFVYFSLSDSLTGVLVIISSLGTHISIYFIACFKPVLLFSYLGPFFWFIPSVKHMKVKSNSDVKNSQTSAFSRLSEVSLSLLCACSWEHTPHCWSGFTLCVRSPAFLKKELIFQCNEFTHLNSHHSVHLTRCISGLLAGLSPAPDKEK